VDEPEKDELAARRGRLVAVNEPERDIVDLRDLDELRLHAAQDRAAAALDREAAAQDRHRAAEYLRESYRDGLTGALQRDAGRDGLTREVERARRSGQLLVIAFLDVVGLKRCNDERGHEAGDQVLRRVGAALADGLRAYDVVVRWGGDEFVCALPDTSIADAGRRLVQVQVLLNSADPPIGLSVGLTELRRDDVLQDAVNRADRDLYARRGRAVTRS
jgi:diguanylate cyclase (GGDEF)-like protein